MLRLEASISQLAQHMESKASVVALILFFSIIFGQIDAAASQSIDVVRLSAHNFDHQISQKPYMVMFYIPI